jgi:hypothetical protein
MKFKRAITLHAACILFGSLVLAFIALMLMLYVMDQTMKEEVNKDLELAKSYAKKSDPNFLGLLESANKRVNGNPSFNISKKTRSIENEFIFNIFNSELEALKEYISEDKAEEANQRIKEFNLKMKKVQEEMEKI